MHYLIILSGPGGSGKDTIIEALLHDPKLNLNKLVNHTSRHPRAGEKDGVDYYFLSREQFEKQIERGHMLEYEIMESNNHYYGTNKEELMRDLEHHNVICKKMPKGSLVLKQFFTDQAITIFVDADNGELEHRLLEGHRSLEHHQVERRLTQGQHERELTKKFDYYVLNHDGHLDQTIAHIRAIVAQKIKNKI